MYVCLDKYEPDEFLPPEKDFKMKKYFNKNARKILCRMDKDYMVSCCNIEELIYAQYTFYRW